MPNGTRNTTNKRDKWRVQLDFSEKALAELDQLKEILSASARAEVVRDAIRWFSWCTQEVSQGGTILLEREGKLREIVFPFFTK